MIRRLFSSIGFLALAACAGGNSGGNVSNIPAALESPKSTAQLVSTSFSVNTGKLGTSGAKRLPRYIGAGAQSVIITLNAVNGAAPPAGLTPSIISSIVSSNCPCTVNGPFVPPGNDSFTFSTTDGPNGTGNAIATFAAAFVINVGSANSGNIVTLAGVPKSFSFGTVPNALVGSAFGSAQSLALTVQDADGNTISGTYANPVTVTTTDTVASQLVIDGAAAASSVQLVSSSSALALTYNGTAIAPSTISASATGATGANTIFAPILGSIVYSGPTLSNNPEIDLYATSGTGSSANFTVSEVGTANSFTGTTTGCSGIGTLSGSPGHAFSFTAAASPVAGSCTIRISDVLGQTKNIVATYTSSGFGVN